MEKAVRGATKSKRAAPKQKYLDALISATTHDDSLDLVLKCLNNRLKEHSWTVVFKSLIVIHILISQGIEQTKNIHSYAKYLEESIEVYRDLKINYISVLSENNGIGRLRNLTVAKGLLREVKIVQKQMNALLLCKFFLEAALSNEVTLYAFNLIVKDLISLFQAINEGVINVLEHYMEMSKIDARDALQIYKTFVKQTEKVVDFLGAAKGLSIISGMNLKHTLLFVNPYNPYNNLNNQYSAQSSINYGGGINPFSVNQPQAPQITFNQDTNPFHSNPFRRLSMSPGFQQIQDSSAIFQSSIDSNDVPHSLNQFQQHSMNNVSGGSLL
ncbi:3507_t:CDS:2 [Diversispora eburnea]|uniref:3507_t:CDS:1 n=1 Tax=Diversispora eburnea TaxID=1213867 RepID=A0A9N9A4W2_9GLOM|nr:3507_t:CDS:2 [Diversispora eburnea]